MESSVRLTIIERVRLHVGIPFAVAQAVEHHTFLRFHNHVRGYQQTLKRCVYALHQGSSSTGSIEDLVAGHAHTAGDESAAADSAPATTTSIYTCPRCKSRNIQSYQRQTRSADEGMTVFCQCLACEKRWRR